MTGGPNRADGPRQKGRKYREPWGPTSHPGPTPGRMSKPRAPMVTKRLRARIFGKRRESTGGDE